MSLVGLGLIILWVMHSHCNVICFWGQSKDVQNSPTQVSLLAVLVAQKQLVKFRSDAQFWIPCISLTLKQASDMLKTFFLLGPLENIEWVYQIDKFIFQ